MIVLDYCNKGLPIYLNEVSEDISYKDNIVPFRHIKLAFESGKTRVQLKDNLFYNRVSGLVEYGCLTLTEEKVQQLIKKVCKILKKS
jgi:hypothetical protein